MDTARGDTPPDQGPPYPAPPGPLPGPIGPPAPYEDYLYEWKEDDDIAFALKELQAALAHGRARYSRVHSVPEQLLEHDVAHLAHSVESALKLLKYLVRQTRCYQLYVESDVRKAMRCCRKASLPSRIVSPPAGIDLRFQHHLAALEELSAAGKTLESKLSRYKSLRSRHPNRTSMGRLYSPSQLSSPTSQHVNGEDIPNLEQASRMPDPSQIRCTAHVIQNKTTLEPRIAASSIEENREDESSSRSKVLTGTLAQDDDTTIHLRGGFSTVEFLAFSETPSDTESGSYFELLLTKCLNRIEYPEGEVTKFGAGESYRPTAHARPRSPDRDRSPRRDRGRSPPISDSYHPGVYSLP
jgi:hypothetical protein